MSCRGDGVGELVLWRAAFFVVALCGSVVAANGCALVTGRRSPLWTAPIDETVPVLRFTPKCDGLLRCSGRPWSSRRAALVRSRASRRASDEKNASEDGFASCGVTRTIRLEIEVALSHLCAAPVLIRAAQTSVSDLLVPQVSFCSKSACRHAAASEHCTPAAERACSASARTTLHHSNGDRKSHAPLGPPRHDLRVATEPQGAAASWPAHRGLDARRLPDADARLLI